MQTCLCSWYRCTLKWARICPVWNRGGEPCHKALQEAAVCMRGWLPPWLWNMQDRLRRTQLIFIPVSVNYSWRVQPLVNHPLQVSKYKPYFIPSWEYNTEQTSMLAVTTKRKKKPLVWNDTDWFKHSKITTRAMFPEEAQLRRKKTSVSPRAAITIYIYIHSSGIYMWGGEGATARFSCPGLAFLIQSPALLHKVEILWG